jgi:selenide, water dikinase
VYVWEGGPALVQTVDFFTPVVDDPYVYGQIAAANALSDVYAMGGQPRTALAIAGFPKDALDTAVISAIFKGGYDKLREAGVALLGGHTIQDPEIKFGYAVTGAVDPARILTNAGARPGDVLILTKALGTGVIATALKFGRVPDDVLEFAVASMRTLNKAAAEALSRSGEVHACTDITGFGLLGHGVEMATASDVSLSFVAADVPVLKGAFDLAKRNVSGGMTTNLEHFGAFVSMGTAVAPELAALFYDPQTSGGLLIAVAPASTDRTLEALHQAGVAASIIGQVVEQGSARIRIL